jgi:hypothetical protein
MSSYLGYAIVIERGEAGYHVRASDGSDFLYIFDSSDNEEDALLHAYDAISAAMLKRLESSDSEQSRNEA